MQDHPRLRRSPVPRPKVGIVHLGPGAFFRAFNAIYTAEAMQAAGGDWGIRAVSLRSPHLRDCLAPQGYAYTAVELAREGARRQVVEVISDILVAPEDPGAVLAALTDPAVRIVSMTITEKGYCHIPATGHLQSRDADPIHDLANPKAPRSALGFLVYALALRRAAGTAPFTVLSCDNLPGNGQLTRRLVLEFARAVDPALADWIATKGRFPSTMVDRITPATTPEAIADLAQATGYLDPGCVTHEPFRQWVIEDDFVGGARPQWDRAGAQFVRDVTPFETMKLRCLNGTHSILAYLGYLAGYATISETVEDPAFAALLDHLWAAEIIPTVPQPEATDLAAYCATLKQRYLNPSIAHRTWQIAMDGSQKLPQRLLGTVSDNLAAGRSIRGLALGVVGWMRYVGGVDEAGAPIDVRDPLASRLRAASDKGASPTDRVNALLAMTEIFPTTLAEDPRFRDALHAAFDSLTQRGARAAALAIL